MMEQPNQFRSAFNGFNRDDVVRYMEFINNKHAAQVAQLSNELEYLRGKQDTLDASRVSELEKQLSSVTAENDTLKHRIAVLEHSLQEANAALASTPAPVPQAPSDSELEAYRRAERVERLARERARQVGLQTAAAMEQTAAALGQTTDTVDEAAAKLSQIAQDFIQKLEQIQSAVDDGRQTLADGRQTFQDAAAAMQQLNTETEA